MLRFFVPNDDPLQCQVLYACAEWSFLVSAETLRPLALEDVCRDRLVPLLGFLRTLATDAAVKGDPGAVEHAALRFVAIGVPVRDAAKRSRESVVVCDGWRIFCWCFACSLFQMLSWTPLDWWQHAESSVVQSIRDGIFATGQAVAALGHSRVAGPFLQLVNKEALLQGDARMQALARTLRHGV